MNFILLDTYNFKSISFHFYFWFFQIFNFGPFHRVVLEVRYQEISPNLFPISSYQSYKHFLSHFAYYSYSFFHKKWVCCSMQLPR
jgi:hypothetical protein